MFTILWLLLVSFAVTISVVWVLDHNGMVMINWLGYEIKTDILTAFLLSFLIAALVALISYFLARIFAAKFPNIFKIFFKRTYVKRLEALVDRHRQGLEILQQLLLALENNDLKNAANLQKRLAILVKNPHINNFFLGKISYLDNDFSEACEAFSKIAPESKYVKILVLKSKFANAMQKHENAAAIAYGRQILSLQKNDLQTAKSLLVLYRKGALWQEARALLDEFGMKNFKEELQRRESASINSAIALDFYRKRDFSRACKYAKIALSFDDGFFEATEILLKSQIKSGRAFFARRLIKKMWKERPNLALSEIFDLTNRKKSASTRISSMKKMVATNSSHLADLAVGITALRVARFKEAQEYLQASLLKKKSYRGYKALSMAERFLGNVDKAKTIMSRAEELRNDDSEGRFN